MAEGILKNLAKRQTDRLLRSSVEPRAHLGDKLNIYVVQQGLLGPLLLSPSMGPIFHEAARRISFYIAKETESMIKKLPDYRGIAKSKNLDEAKLSTEFTNLQMRLQLDGDGLLSMTEYRKGELIVFQVEECVECFGLGNIGGAVCYSTAGKLGGAMQAAFHKDVGTVETKCAARGDPYCEFRYTFQ